MANEARLIGVGVAAVLLFDLLASLASLRFGFSYGRASVGSYLVYLAIGFVAARTAATGPIAAAAFAAGAVGLADASIGWAISWALGPGRLPATQPLTPARWLRTAAFVVVLAAVVGALGGVAGRRPPDMGANVA